MLPESRDYYALFFLQQLDTFLILKLFLIICICTHVLMPTEATGIEPPRTRVIGDCKLPGVELGNLTLLEEQYVLLPTSLSL